jgi:hypothetical protein
VTSTAARPGIGFSKSKVGSADSDGAKDGVGIGVVGIVGDVAGVAEGDVAAIGLALGLIVPPSSG